MRFLLSLALFFSPSAFAGAADVIRARDLDATTQPHRLDFDPGTLQLEVDGKLVRGSKRKQLDYLEIVLAEDRGVDPAVLGIDQRRRELRRRSAGLGLISAASGVGIVATVVAAPYAIALGAPVIIQAGGVGAIVGTKKRFDAEGLQRQVDLYGIGDVYASR